MLRLIIIAVIAFAVYWCFNNVNFNNITDNIKGSVQNEKTIKAVNDKRAFDYEEENNAMNNEQ
ncbi:MAG: hypothetical protein MJ237_04040 [bacterium]|nr:hypothetical protein [bacterium]